jgi:hypothetical protein
MEAIIDKVMQTFGMMNTLTVEQAEDEACSRGLLLKKSARRRSQGNRGGANLPPRAGDLN